MRMKMLCLTVRIKRNDELQGKLLQDVLFDFLLVVHQPYCYFERVPNLTFRLLLQAIIATLDLC